MTTAEEYRQLIGTLRANFSAHGIQEGLEQTTVQGASLRVCGRLMLLVAAEVGDPYIAVGGRGPYAGALARAMSMESSDGHLSWFALREKPRDHATGRLVEGGRIDEGEVPAPVIVVDTGADDENLLAACRDVQTVVGARLVAAVTLVDLDYGVGEQLSAEFPAARYAAVLGRSDLALLD